MRTRAFVRQPGVFYLCDINLREFRAALPNERVKNQNKNKKRKWCSISHKRKGHA